jgi:hypothetical protein
MQHYCYSFDVLRNIHAERFRLVRRYPADGLREYETNGKGTGTNRRLYMLLLAETADFDQQTHEAILALPASRIALMSVAGSSLRMNALPTNAN